MHQGNVYKFPNQVDPKRFFARAGWVYVLANEAMPGLYKIGMTTGCIERRMSQLYTTGVPTSFDCIFAEWFADCLQAERFIHDRLEPHRLDYGREFFEADVQEIAHAFMSYSAEGEEVPDSIVDLYAMRRRQAEAAETVNGVLVARVKRTSSWLEVPF